MAGFDLGIDFEKLLKEDSLDIGDIAGFAGGSMASGLDKIAGGVRTGTDALGRIAQLGRVGGGGGGDTLARIADYGGGQGGGGNLDFFSQVGQSDPFKSFNSALASRISVPPSAPDTPVGGGGGGGTTGGTGATGSWGAHEKYRDLYTKVANEMGLDPDEVAAFAQIETSNADPNATSPAGAMGLLQVMPFHFKPGQNPYDPETNVRVALAYYKAQRDKYGPGLAAAAYQGGDGAIVNGRARTDVSDGNMTPAQYAAQWQANYDRIKATAPATGTAVTGDLNMIWGGSTHAVTQEIGVVTPGIDQGIYGYGAQMGVSGHTGLDIGTPHGTKLYAPMSGTVVNAGGTGVYRDETGGNPATSGEIKIRLDNGHELILGHTSSISVKVGQRVTAGMLLGLSGTANGPHLHLEYRIPDPSTPSKWRIVDPRTYLGGGGTRR